MLGTSATVEGTVMAKKSTGIMDSIEKMIGLGPEKGARKTKAKKKTVKKVKAKKSTKNTKRKTAKKAKSKTKR
jgi:hypothetical protein